MSASVLNPTKRADMSADMSADTFGSKHADLADMSGNTLFIFHLIIIHPTITEKEIEKQLAEKQLAEVLLQTYKVED